MISLGVDALFSKGYVNREVTFWWFLFVRDNRPQRDNEGQCLEILAPPWHSLVPSFSMPRELIDTRHGACCRTSAVVFVNMELPPQCSSALHLAHPCVVITVSYSCRVCYSTWHCMKPCPFCDSCLDHAPVVSAKSVLDS